jgi:hypothetical protein
MEKISFVVQGPVLKESDAGVYSTFEVLNSIRTNYKDAEIVLSTWKESDITGLDYDQLVLSDDPGGYTHFGVQNNCNRLILSSRSGIEKASNRYVVKTRSDILFTGPEINDKLKFIEPVKSEYGIFNKMVLSTNFYVRNPIKLNLVFHPSDILLIGEREDLLSYFDVPLAPRNFYINDDESTRIVPEQYFFVHSILKKRNIDFHIPRWGYTKLKYFTESEKYLFNNFTIFDTSELGVQFPDRLYSVFMADANYTLSEAHTLSKVYREKPLYGRFVILSRTLQYLSKYYAPYLLGALKRRVFRQFATQI